MFDNMVSENNSNSEAVYEKEMFFENTEQNASSELIFISSAGITLPESGQCIINIPDAESDAPIFSFEYVYSGYGYIEMNSKKYPVCPGDGFILSSEREYKCYPDQNRPFHKIWIRVGGRVVSTLMSLYFPEPDAVLSHGISQEHFDQIKDILLSDRVLTHGNTAASAIYEIILSIYNKSRGISQTAKHADRAKIIIDRDWGYRLTVDDVGRIMKLSPTYVSELFRKNYGVPLKTYIMKRKIDAAKKLIRANQASMSDIAEILNFSSIYHFSSAFKNIEGMTPSEYRTSIINKKQ